MTIQETSEKIIIELNGRIDSVNAPAVGKEIMETLSAYPDLRRC